MIDAMLSIIFASLLAGACLTGAAPTSSDFTFYDLPTPESGPCDICEGHDGMVYIQNFLVDTLVRLNPTTGEMTEYKIPYKNPPSPTSVLPSLGNRTALACAIRPGDDGKIYAASGVRNEIVVLDATSGSLTVYAQPSNDPLGNVFPFNDLWPGPTGVCFYFH
jgi:streptogramin lyase